MKKQILLMAGAAALVLAVSCHRNPAFRSTPAPSVVNPTAPTAAPQPTTMPSTAPSTTPSAPVPAPAKAPAPTGMPYDPAAGAKGMMNPDIAAGRVIYTGKCAKCHQPKPVDNWTEQEWVPILRSMVKKSKLDSLETNQVTLYVNMNAKKG